MLEGQTHDSLLISRAADKGGGAQSLSHHPHADRSRGEVHKTFSGASLKCKETTGGKKIINWLITVDLVASKSMEALRFLKNETFYTHDVRSSSCSLVTEFYFAGELFL